MVYVAIDDKSKQSKAFIAFLASLNFIHIYNEPNAVTKKAMKDVKEGKTIKADSVKDFLSKLNE